MEPLGKWEMIPSQAQKPFCFSLGYVWAEVLIALGRPETRRTFPLSEYPPQCMTEQALLTRVQT